MSALIQLAVVTAKLGLLLSTLWTVLRFTMPGEEKILTNAFRSHCR